MNSNSAIIQNYGQQTIEFSDKTKLNFYIPSAFVDGTITGNSCLSIVDKMCLDYQEFNLRAYIEYGKKPKKGKFSIAENKELNKRKDICFGYIYNCDFSKAEVINYDKYTTKDCEKIYKLKDAQMKEVRSEIQGSFISGLEFDGKEYWNPKNYKFMNYKRVRNPLPSDTRFREDLLWLVHGDLKKAAEWKTLLDRQVHSDVKLRSTYCKKNKLKLYGMN